MTMHDNYLFYIPVIAVYPLGFAAGPISAVKVVFSLAIICTDSKGSH